MEPKWFKVPSKRLLIFWLCLFTLVRNMWGFLATSHAPITSNENLSNKPYFYLGLLANLADLLIPVDAKSIVSGIFYPFTPLSPSRYGIPLGVLYYCWAKTKFWSIWCVYNSLGIWMFYHFRYRRSLAGRTFLYVQFGLWQHKSFIIILWSDTRLVTWGFSGIFPKNCCEPSIPKVNILWCTTIVSVLHKIYPIWGYCSFPHESNCGKCIIRHYIKFRWDMNSF